MDTRHDSVARVFIVTGKNNQKVDVMPYERKAFENIPPNMQKAVEILQHLAKGEHGSTCNRTACNISPATWWNPHTGKFYCTRCAMRINVSLAEHNLELCIQE